MIHINMTILIQMANFIIAYIIIRKLLLDPAAKIIRQEEEGRVQILSTIQQLKNANTAKEDTLANRWATCQRNLQNQSPKVILAEKTVSSDQIAPSMDTPRLEPETIKPIIAQVAHELTERLSHVR